jgi:hypothetical protein
MKKHLAMLLLALVSTQSLRADLLGLGNMTADGSLEISGQQANNETDADNSANDHRGNVLTRLRLGLNAELADDVKARVEAVRNSQSGPTIVQYGDGYVPGGATGASTITAEEGAIAFQNAYIDLENFLGTDWLRLGRHYGGRPGDLLVFYGPYQDDYLRVHSLDGLGVGRKFGPVTAQFVTGKVNEDDTFGGAAHTDAGDATGDTNVNWLILNSSELFPDVAVPLEIGYYQGTQSNTAAASDNNTLTILDLRAGYNELLEGALKLGAEFAMNGGQQNAVGGEADYKGTALLLNATYDNPDHGFGLGLSYANASGTDPNSTGTDDDTFHDFRTIGWPVSDYRYGEILSQDNVAWTNLATVLGAPVLTVPGGLDTGPTGPGLNIVRLGGYYVIPRWDEKVRVSADYIMAKLNEDLTVGGDDGLGKEIDLAVHYDHSSAVRATAGYAMFSPDSDQFNPNDQVTKLFAKLAVKFGQHPDMAQGSMSRTPARTSPARATPASTPARKR